MTTNAHYKIIPFTQNASRHRGQSIEGWLAVTTDNNMQTIGHIFMELHKDKRIKFLDAWVHPNWRRQGIFRSLWDTRWAYIKANYTGYTVYAWCLPTSLPLLIEKGFETGTTSTYVEREVRDDEPPMGTSHGYDCPVTC